MTTFKEFERTAWEQKAHRYEDTWGAVTSQTMEAMLDAARVGRGTTMLDCGCGPGAMTHLAAQRGADVIGCDYSSSMLEIARAAYPDLRFVQEDAEELSFEDRSFDAVVLSFLLLHVAKPGQVLLEANRVLRPGGRLAFSLWRRPAESPGLRLIFDALSAYADMSVIPPADDIFLFADRATAEKFLMGNGFADISFTEFPTEWRAPKEGDFFTAIQAGTRMGGLVDHQTPEIKEKLKAAILKGIESYRGADGIVLPLPSIIVSATKSRTT